MTRAGVCNGRINTAVPTANLHEDQLRGVIEFLQRGQVTVDIFAAGPVRPIETGTGGAVRGDTELRASLSCGARARISAIGLWRNKAQWLLRLYRELTEQSQLKLHEVS